MRFYAFVAAAALLSASLAAHADSVTASAVPTLAILPSADTLSLNGVSSTVTLGGSFTQTGTFYVGDSFNYPMGTLPISFTDTFTVDGVTEALTFTGTDALTEASDVLTINALGAVEFGPDTVNFAGFTSAPTGLYDSSSVAVTGTLTSVTPEPSSIALLGTGMLGLAGVVRKRFV